ncbi:MAG: BatD family protein [Myxococcales bacterium]|nr:BatD family protein [Myxococcales bacterium]
MFVGFLARPTQRAKRCATSTTLLLCALLGWLLPPAAALAEVTVEMQADRTEIPLDGQVVVQIRVTSDSLRGAKIQLPDFDGFEIMRQSVQRPMQFSFGLGGQQRVQSTTHYTFVLRPTRAGRIVIPPVLVDAGQRRLESQALAIMVGRAGQASPLGKPPDVDQPDPSEPDSTESEGAQHGDRHAEPTGGEQDGDAIDARELDPDAFVRTVVDKRRPHEREQVTVTIYLYVRERLHEAPVVETEPTTDGFWTQDLQQSNTLEQRPAEQVGRARFRVYVMRRFAAFPLRAGELTIGPMSLTIRRPATVFQIFGRGNGPRPPLKRQGQTVTLEVQPLPEDGRPGGEVAVGRYAIGAKLDRDQVATGDAATLTATIRGYGHIQSVRLATPKIEGLQILAPETRDLVESPDDHVGGTRVYEWLVVPKAPGTYRLPAFVVNTFDPVHRRYVQVKSDPLTLTAAGLALATETPGAAQEDGSPSQPDPHERSPKGKDTELSWGPIRHQSELSRGGDPARLRGLLPWGLSVPPLAWLLLVGAGALVRAQRSRQLGHAELATRDAKRHMRLAADAARQGDGTTYHASLSSALTRLLEARLGEQVGSDTRPALRRRVLARGMDGQLADGVIRLLERCDEARFSPSSASADDLQNRHAEARSVFERLGTFEPTPKEPRT